jgi:predicted TIM-barrel fold metal-dependent hydrolase
MTDYTGPVIDTHHHIWLRKDVSWLAEPPIPRMFGDYFGLRRDYPVEEFMADVTPQGVVKSVHVTANWGLDRSLDETRWLQSVADKHGFPHGIVAQVDLADSDIETKLKAHRQFPNFRGVRQMLYWDTDPVRQSVSRPDYCNDRDFRRGFALLEKYDLSFELQVYAPQAAHAVELVKAFPNVRMILVHAGMLTERTSQAIDQWRGALTALAACPNLNVKLSGLGMYSSGITFPQARQMIRDAIQIFGAGRTIYGSNFPLEKLHASYADFFGHYRIVMSEYTEAEQRAVFHDNATRFYRV